MNKLGAVMVALLMLSGCASTLDDKTYSRDDARRVQQVEFGTIEAITDVVIEGRRSGVSKVAGAVVGGIAGSSVGGGKGKDLTTALGAIAGTIAGEAIEERSTRANGQDLTVRMDRGELISVVQELTEQGRFRTGDRVRILRLNGEVRVSPWPHNTQVVDPKAAM
ncbi:MAG: glycine zipper 2TM domain-containing protein [Motiliproteus sp.]|nr:glycine zipper 2TM domain-containing protein [Motiliproteus sp.]MCW9053883.1 glycine zipper 2TM domain-containing protein [Motiliproteus sp.]